MNALVARNYAEAYMLLSPHAKVRMSLNQFVPSADDSQFAANERTAVANPTAVHFAGFMAKLEADRGAPLKLEDLHVFSTDAAELSGTAEPLDVMFAIGNMPKSVPANIRKASLRGQINTKLSPAQLQEAAKAYGMKPEELEKDEDFRPYFTIKLVLVEEQGVLSVGYFEFLPPSMLD